MARRKRTPLPPPLEDRLREAAEKWKPLPVGLLLAEALRRIESLEEEIMYAEAGESI